MIGTLCLWAATNAPARAAGPPYTIDREQQNREMRERYEERQRELERIAPPEAPPAVPAPAQPASPEKPACVKVTRIEVTGADHLSADEIARLTAPYVKDCASLADIDQLLSAINKAYVDKGLVTSRAYVPQQDMASGALKLVVVEGKVEGFKVDGQEPGWIALMAFPGMIGEALNLRDIEQGLEQMNRLPSFNAKMKIAPGTEQGASIVQVDAPPAGPKLRAKATLDNNGTTESGRNVAHGEVDGDNLMGLLETWSVAYARSFTSHTSLKVSNDLSASLSVPYGYWTAASSIDRSNYRSLIVGLNQTFGISGDSSKYTGSLTRVLARDQTSKTSLEWGYELKETHSFLEDVRLNTGSVNLASTSLRLSYTDRILGGAWYFTLGYRRGLRGFGTSARDHEDDPSTTPRAQYGKASLDIDGFQPVPVGETELSWHPSLHAEYSGDTLHSQNRLTIGGLYTVRGFQDLGLVGDRGAYLRNDLSWKLPQTGDGDIDPVIGNAELYVGLDAGIAHTATGSSDDAGAIAGWAAGLRNAQGRFIFDTSIARAFAHGPLRSEGYLVNFLFGVSF
jgi:hemolysin activation/secretion protein